MKRTYWQVLIGAVLLLVALPWAMYSEVNAHIAALTVVWCLMAIGWNVISGYAGPLSLGQGAFFGLTSFFSTMLFARSGLTPYVGILVGVVVSLLLALGVGLLTLRLSGLYFALATLTVPLIIGVVVKYLGFFEISRPYKGQSWAFFQFDSSVTYYMVGAVLVVLGMLFTAWLSGTRMGRYFVAIRENERAAEASGVPTSRYKLYAFMIGAAFSALAGGLYSQLAFVFNPDDVFSPLVSVQALLIVLIGGPGTVIGPLIGAAIVIPGGELMAQYFSQLPGLNNLAYAVILFVVALFSRGGLYPVLERLWLRRRRRSRPAVPEQGGGGEPARADDESDGPGRAPDDPGEPAATGTDPLTRAGRR